MTGGDDGDPLRKLEQSGHVECLLEALGKDLPDSVHVFNRISTHLRWRRQGLGGDVQVDFYRGADEGDATSGPTTAVSIMRVEGMAPRVAVHTTDPSCDALRRVLAASKHIPWSEPFLFESVHERCTPAVLAEARARGQVAPPVCPTDKMLLPKDEGLRLQVGDPGPGLRLRALESHHAKAVNDKWSYANPGSERMLAKTIERNPGLSWGVFTEDDPEGDPVSFILGGAWTGGLTVLFTTEPFRRRGLAELVTRAACRALAARHGLDAHCNVDVPNAASRATLAKVGFRRICECSFIDWNPPSSQ